jgi:hypothetical protein
MHNNVFFLERNHYHMKEEEILLVGFELFLNFLLFDNVSWIANMRLYGRQKNLNYILCTLILSNPFHLIVGSKLILTQNELQVPKCCHVNSKVFLLVFIIAKGCHHFTCYTSFFWVKNGFHLNNDCHDIFGQMW